MPRARTKGDRIQVQLPLDADSAVRAKALKTGASPAQVVTDTVVRAVRAKVISIGSSGGVTNGLGEHAHGKVNVNGAGLHVCECGAIRGNDGEWRQV